MTVAAHERKLRRPALFRHVALLAVVTGLASCVSVGTPGQRASAPPPSVAPAPALDAVTRAPTGRIHEEIDQLERFGTAPGARLRIAWLLQSEGSWEEANTVLNGILFDTETDTEDVTALARYLRARGYDHRNDPERAARERALALETVRSPGLRARLLAEGAAGEAREANWAGVAAPTLSLLPRSGWKAASAHTGDMRRMGAIERITIHHSATLVHSKSAAAAKGAIRGIQRHHQVENGWGDIGYHFLIDPAGRVWNGRSLEWQGAHAGDNAKNQFNVGVCLLGNFARDGQGTPPPEQLRALEGLVTALCVRYRVTPANVLTHQELKTTDCPGPFVQVAVEHLRERLAGSLMVAGAAER